MALPRAPDETRGFRIGGGAWNQAVGQIDALANISVQAPLTILRTAGSLVIGIAGEPEEEFDALIDGSTQDGSSKRYFYGWKRSRLNGQSYTAWEAVPDVEGGSSSDVNTRAYNRAEALNTTAAQAADIDPLPDGFDVIPLPDGTPVRIRRVATTNGKTAYWFTHAFWIDGECPPP